MKLIYEESRREVLVHDTVHLPDGEVVRVDEIVLPHCPESTGRVYVTAQLGWSQGFFPSVIGAVWVNRKGN